MYEALVAARPNLPGHSFEDAHHVPIADDLGMFRGYTGAHALQVMNQIIGDLPDLAELAAYSVSPVSSAIPFQDMLVQAALALQGTGLDLFSAGRPEPQMRLTPRQSVVEIVFEPYYMARQAGALLRLMRAYDLLPDVQVRLEASIHRVATLIEPLIALVPLYDAMRTRLFTTGHSIALVPRVAPELRRPRSSRPSR